MRIEIFMTNIYEPHSIKWLGKCMKITAEGQHPFYCITHSMAVWSNEICRHGCQTIWYYMSKILNAFDNIRSFSLVTFILISSVGNHVEHAWNRLNILLNVISFQCFSLKSFHAHWCVSRPKLKSPEDEFGSPLISLSLSLIHIYLIMVVFPRFRNSNLFKIGHSKATAI